MTIKFQVGDRVQPIGRKEIGRVGMILNDGLVIVDYLSQGWPSLSYRPEQLKRVNSRRR